MNIMGSSGSEHEDESAEWRRSARCTSANAIILGLGASFFRTVDPRKTEAGQRRTPPFITQPGSVFILRASIAVTNFAWSRRVKIVWIMPDRAEPQSVSI